MSQRNQSQDRSRDYRDYPVAWFVVLEQARRANDFATAANAQRELERLGVRVKYLPKRKEATHAA